MAQATRSLSICLSLFLSSVPISMWSHTNARQRSLGSQASGQTTDLKGGNPEKSQTGDSHSCSRGLLILWGQRTPTAAAWGRSGALSSWGAQARSREPPRYTRANPTSSAWDWLQPEPNAITRRLVLIPPSLLPKEDRGILEPRPSANTHRHTHKTSQTRFNQRAFYPLHSLPHC